MRRGAEWAERCLSALRSEGRAQEGGCNTAADAYTAPNEYVHWLEEQAAKHAKANGRKTVRAHERSTRRRLAAALGHMLAALGIPAQGQKGAAAEVDRFTPPGAAPVDLT